MKLLVLKNRKINPSGVTTIRNIETKITGEVIVDKTLPIRIQILTETSSSRGKKIAISKKNKEK